MVADSDPRVCKALNMLLKFEPELEIVGESTDALSLVAQVEALKPDLVLLDWELPGNSITAVIESLKRAEKSCQVIILSRRPEAEHAALTVGADAFVSKTDPADSLLHTLNGLIKPHKDAVTAPL
jgi:DNA-binding NarL/FixJ family response regulator